MKIPIKYFGQSHLFDEIKILAEKIEGGQNFSFLIKGGSGMGNTTLALHLMGMFCHFSQRELDKFGQYSIASETVEFTPEMLQNKRFFILDEIHAVENIEYLYQYLDSNKYTFIFCTNQSGELPEALVNRCIVFNLTRYEEGDIIEIVKEYYPTSNNDIANVIANNANLNPRVAIQYSKRLCNINNSISTPEEMKKVMKQFLSVEDGLTIECNIYLEFIKKVKRASLDLISSATRLDKSLIKNVIEPILIEKGLVIITGRGRVFAGSLPAERLEL